MIPAYSSLKLPKMGNVYLKYTGLAAQLFFSIGIGGWLGYELDAYLGLSFPVFMLIFGVGAFLAVIVQLYKSIN